ncbi:MAG: branched-chain amino acid transport system ATP-binding protein [Pseudonocardiales bacterium]|nr:branched-chain amino acid transport system ATP-binding protein [Pseudonocardiales bacterium]
MSDPLGVGSNVAATPPLAATTRASLRVSNVSVHFGGIRALENVSIDFRAGEITGLIGPNGAGKTTLFDVISGLRAPSTGTIEMDGRDITRRSAVWRSRNGLRRTYQRQQVFGQLSVEDNVLVAHEWHGGGGGLLADLVRLPTRKRLETSRRADVARALEVCGLTDVRQRPASQLTIGAARMVELARAIVDEPAVLLLDEPTSGLGQDEVASLGQVLQTIRGRGCCVVLVEHDMAFVMEHSDHVAVLQLGRVIATDTPGNVRNSRLVKEVYLD